ncbi:beta-lactamase family protein [Staphylococcus sp. IVB6181]|uniref:serine hydrolase domain-containing protein n=1 Tax=Staphylococcus sp. IVB6181 TaxID=2929481 RepID=UPI0021D1DF18|nr:serine hydrolase domain-containing protein [Staphylococcus sp. IVB6181]UXV34333.1 beta-lactamase family protein [Staphylococcus sp. IVB6181]
MKNKAKHSIVFIIAVAILAAGFSYFLNWRYQNRYSMKQPTVAAENKSSHGYQKVMDSNAAYQNVDRYLKQQHFNGNITIYHKGKLVMDQSYGYQDFEAMKPTSPNSMYLIGSAQKFTTGLMLKKLEVEGKVNINDPIDKYLPWFKTSKPLILKDIMLHRSGLKKFNGSPTAHSIEDVAKELQQADIQPGMYKKHLYSDGNYIVLAAVIQSITKEPFAKYFNETLRKPYDLRRTAFYNEKNYESDMAKGYNVKRELQQMKFLDQYYGAGNLFMSSRDMAKLVVNLQENKIFSPAITQKMLEEVKTNDYPSTYRYGFYSYGAGNRINGMFYGHQMTSYFNKEYVVVMGTNYQYPRYVNEKLLTEIFTKDLHQPNPTKLLDKKPSI